MKIYSSKQIMKTVGFVSVLMLAWFLLVDKMCFVEKCPACIYGRMVVQYRVLMHPFYEKVAEHDSLLRKVAYDLGVPCLHPKLFRETTGRFKGLFIRAGEVKGGTYFLIGDDLWYDEDASAKVRAMAKQNPELPDEFYRRVFVGRDNDYCHAFLKQLREQL